MRRAYLSVPALPANFQRSLRLHISGPRRDPAAIDLPGYGWWRLGSTNGYSYRPNSEDYHGIYTQVHVVNGLAPGSEYHVSLRTGAETPGRPRGSVVAEAKFETLPARLPTVSSVNAGERPFTMLLGSCYWVDKDDGGSVANRYKRLYSDPAERPHLKLLVGDQVYLDQPPDQFGLTRMDTGRLMAFITDRYKESWHRLQGLLSSGANICTTDDHEYWNDYPNTPHRIVWPSLSNRSFRNRMERTAREFVAHVQLSRAVESFTIGNPPQLSVFVADTRMHRAPGRHTFMREPDMDQLVDWLAGLKCPGVLVLGQPLFAPPVSRWSGLFRGQVDDSIANAIITDINLPGFRQFRRLARALQYASHDVCVLAGDVHFGRVARVHLFRRDDGAEPRTLFEVIASPMTQLPGAADAFKTSGSDSPFAAGSSVGPLKYPLMFPASTRDIVPGVIPGLIKWDKTVPTKPGDDQRTEEHFMTLGFSEAGNGAVHVKVSAWLVRRPLRADGLPHLAWREEFTLRKKGGLDISGARSLLLEQEDIPGARSLLLEQGDIPGARFLLTDNETEE